MAARVEKRNRAVLYLRSISVTNSAFRPYWCHPWPAKLLMIRLTAVSNPTLSAISFATKLARFERAPY